MSGSSELWKYFKKIKTAECDLCEKNDKKKTCTYTNESDLKSHLRKQHKDTYNKLWPPTETRSSQQYHQSNISIPSSDTPSTTIQNRRPYACAVDDEGPRSNKRQKSMDSYPDRNISNEQEENINLSSARRPMDAHHSIPSTSTRTTSTTIQNRGPYVAIEKPASNNKISDVKKQPLKVKITGLVGNYSSDEILGYLKDQNDVFSEGSHLKVLEPWPIKNNPKIHQTIIELDAATYVSVMDRGKLSVDFNTCSVYDSNNIRFCHRCCGFDHGQQKCSRKVTCPKCAGDHISNYCSSSVYKCLNCANANLTDNSHAAWDAVKCPIFKKKLDYLN